MSDIFFERIETRQTLAKLSKPSNWTIYVGLGATIDRTGASWRALIDGLLQEFESDSELRDLILDSFHEVPTATIVESLFAAKHPESADRQLESLQAGIRRVLYGNQQFLAGEILPLLARLAFTLAAKGSSVVFLTPNYDSYLYRELRLLSRYAKEGLLLDKRVVTGAGKGSSWDSTWAKAGKISCIYLHGYVGPKRSAGEPVLGEMSYANSADRSSKIIQSAIRDRNLLILGSSLTDAPLVNGLIADKTYYDRSNSMTRKSATKAAAKPARVVLQPKQSNEFSRLSDTDRDRLIDWNTRRFRAIGVDPVYPDYYFQVGQFVSELQQCVLHNDGREMLREQYKRSYHSRLDRWWAEWSKHNLDPKRQTLMVRDLQRLLGQIRSVANIPQAEGLKLELWVRWKPQRDLRELALWASSLGPWNDSKIMRRDRIGLGSPYRSVEIFCGGAPKFLTAERDIQGSRSPDRWRTYLGVPVWVEGPKGTLPVGVIALASMYDVNRGENPPSSVSVKNLDKLVYAIHQMKEFGGMKLATSSMPLRLGD